MLGVGWKPKVGYTIHQHRDRAMHCVFSKAHAEKQPQCICQAWTVVGSSLTPHAALLVRPSGTIQPVVDCHEFTWSERCCL